MLWQYAQSGNPSDNVRLPVVPEGFPEVIIGPPLEPAESIGLLFGDGVTVCLSSS
jgi:hypothetical protein